MASERVPVAGPDFICIGMPKAGTGWLYDQLQFHPDFWMPPTKEFDYLKREVPRMKNAVARLGRARERFTASEQGGQIEWGNRRKGDERDLMFLEAANELVGQPMDVERYADLFRFKGELLSGDVSPSYITLTDETIGRVGRQLPETKIIFLVRDPVARTASQISMAFRLGKVDEALAQDEDRFRTFLGRSTTTNPRAFPTEIVARWKDLAPNLTFQWFLFDDIEGRPAHARREILNFLGADPAKTSGELPPEENRKATKEKLPLDDDAVALLVEHFAGELKASAKVFGGAAESWGARYGL
jgi:hypothetical protein